MHRETLKAGDFFNIVRKPNGSEEWDKQNRFSTCQLLNISQSGIWEYVEYWDRYSDKDYPFLSSKIYWNVRTEYAQDTSIIYQISDPETEGFKNKKAYLPMLISKRIETLSREYKQIEHRTINDIIFKKRMTTRDMKALFELENISSRIEKMGGVPYTPFQNLVAREEYKYPYFTFKTGLNTLVEAAKLSEISIPTKEFMFIIDDQTYKIPFSQVLPNRQLYPIDFAIEYPWDSIFKKSEIERLAQRVLFFMDKWDNPLSWENYYGTLTDADKQVAYSIKRDFDKIQDYLKSPQSCASFSKSWKKVLTDFEEKQYTPSV